jgi:hypothetical protein
MGRSITLVFLIFNLFNHKENLSIGFSITLVILSYFVLITTGIEPWDLTLHWLGFFFNLKKHKGC